MLASLCVFAVAAIAYVIIGFSWQGTAGSPAHVLLIGGRAWNWIAAEPLFLRGLHLDLSPASLVLLLQIFSVGLAAMIPLGAGAERWKLGASCVSTILLAGWTYPLFAHWVWSEWLAGATRIRLRAGPRVCGQRRLGHDSGDGRAERVVHRLDSRPTPREIFIRGRARRNSSSQCRAGAGWVPAGVDGMARSEFSGRDFIQPPGHLSCRADRGKYNAVGSGGGANGSHGYEAPVWPPGCIVSRQRVDGGPGRQQWGGGISEAADSDPGGSGCGRVGAFCHRPA